MAHTGEQLPETAEGHRSYDPASVASFMAQAEAERARLLLDVEAARHQVAAAEAAAAAASFEAQARLASLVLEAHRELIAARQANAQAVAQILADADAEAARILAAAHDEVTLIQAGSAVWPGPAASVQ